MQSGDFWPLYSLHTPQHQGNVSHNILVKPRLLPQIYLHDDRKGVDKVTPKGVEQLCICLLAESARESDRWVVSRRAAMAACSVAEISIP